MTMVAGLFINTSLAHGIYRIMSYICDGII